MSCIYTHVDDELLVTETLVQVTIQSEGKDEPAKEYKTLIQFSLGQNKEF